jgi:hypothetical protein
VLGSVQSTAGQLLGLLGGPDNVVDVWFSNSRKQVLVLVRDLRLLSTSSKSSSDSVIRAVKSFRDQTDHPASRAMARVEVVVPPHWAEHVTDELGWNVECSRAARGAS